MAGVNNFLLMNNSTSSGLNILTDDLLKATDWDETGIVANEVAYSNRLNAILRQITTVTHGWAGLMATELQVDVGSYDDAPSSIVEVTETRIKSALEVVTLQFAVDKRTVRSANSVWAGPATGVATAPAFRALVADDIPNLDTSKITTGTFATEFIENLAVTNAKIANLTITGDKLVTKTITSGKIADNNIGFTKLLQSAAAGLSVIGRPATGVANFSEVVAGTDGYVLRRDGAALGFGQVVAAGIATDAVETTKIKNQNVSLVKLSRADVLIDDGTKVRDTLISARHTSVVGKVGPTGDTYAAYTIRIVTQAEYNTLTKVANTIYIVQD